MYGTGLQGDKADSLIYNTPPTSWLYSLPLGFIKVDIERRLYGVTNRHCITANTESCPTTQKVNLHRLAN